MKNKYFFFNEILIKFSLLLDKAGSSMNIARLKNHSMLHNIKIVISIVKYFKINVS